MGQSAEELNAWSEIKKAFPEEGHLCKPDCGLCCCAGAYVEAQEAEAIGAWICKNVSVKKLSRQFGYADTNPDKCPFLTPKKTCLIYPVRPVVCRMYGHLKDTPGMPKWCSMQCPEGIGFTLLGPDEYLDVVRPWFDATAKAFCRIADFRKAELYGADGKQIVL